MRETTRETIESRLDPAWPAAARHLVTDLTTGLADVLGGQLRSVIVFGSLVTGDFDVAVSDVDVLVVTDQALTPALFADLGQVHAAVTGAHPTWVDRLEVVYVPEAGVAAFREANIDLAAVSPGEPFHTTSGSSDWLINYYVAREYGRAVFGARPDAVLPEISEAELRCEAACQLQVWRVRVRLSQGAHPGAIAYAVLTAARALYTAERGEIVSKRAAAVWALDRAPQWGPLLTSAVRARALGGYVGEVDFAAAVGFIDVCADAALRDGTESWNW